MKIQMSIKIQNIGITKVVIISRIFKLTGSNKYRQIVLVHVSYGRSETRSITISGVLSVAVFIKKIYNNPAVL